MDPATAAKAAQTVQKLLEKDQNGQRNITKLLTVGVVIIAFVVCMVFLPIFCITHPIKALKIAAGSEWDGENDTNIEYLGYIAGKYETGTSDAAAISSGAGDHGGKSYGIPQFPSNGGNGSMAKLFTIWLKEQNEELGSLFDGVAVIPGGALFDNAWKAAAELDYSAFANYQIAYSHQQDVVPLVDKVLADTGIDLNRSRCLQELAISTGQQYGPGTGASLIKKSGATAEMSDDEIIRKVYEYKRNTVGIYFRSSSSNVQSSLRNGRFVNEEQDLLAIVGVAAACKIGEDEGTAIFDNGEDYSQYEKDSGYELLKNFIYSFIISGDEIVENEGVYTGISGGAYTGGGVPLYLQGDYKNVDYGSHGTISSSGCGPTSMAMVATYITGQNILPTDTASWSVSHGYRADVGTSWGFFTAYPSAMGFTGVNTSYSKENITNVLKSGKIMICSMKPGHFTRGGHFIVLRGITADGKILVNDPASRERSQQEWDVSIVSSECKQAWYFCK